MDVTVSRTRPGQSFFSQWRRISRLLNLVIPHELVNKQQQPKTEEATPRMNPYALAHMLLVMTNTTNPNEYYEMSMPTDLLSISGIANLYHTIYPDQIPAYDPNIYDIQVRVAKRGTIHVPGYNNQGERLDK